MIYIKHVLKPAKNPTLAVPMHGFERSAIHHSLGAGNRKNASLANPTTSDARSVMLRIPLPEDDGFALAKRAHPLQLFGKPLISLSVPSAYLGSGMRSITLLASELRDGSRFALLR